MLLQIWCRSRWHVLHKSTAVQRVQVSLQANTLADADAVKARKHSILEEVEKHHPDVRDWLVQLMHPDAASRITAQLALEADVLQED